MSDQPESILDDVERALSSLAETFEEVWQHSMDRLDAALTKIEEELDVSERR